MPKLKQINCSIELGPNNAKLKEYGARYSDGHVEAFVAVPDTGIPFTIHLQSQGYIAPGLALFVFMDGEYQCNRNRIGLKLPGEGIQPQEYETEFRVRQKEEKTGFGTFVVRDWTFAKLDRVAADKAPKLNPQFTSNVGTIEVIVLRCKSDLDDNPPPRATRAQIPNKPASRTDAKRSAAAAPAASAKAATPQQSEIGGLFGLFDGACDLLNVDGAGDEQPVGADGRVKPKPPPGMVWDSMAGQFVPEDAYGMPPTEVDFPNGLEGELTKQLDAMQRELDEARLDGQGGLEAMQRELNEARAQLDGHGGHPGPAKNRWGDRGRDDMRGDKYLGLEDQDRDVYKQYMRETGESVSSLTDNEPLPNRNPFLKQFRNQEREQRVRTQGHFNVPPNNPPQIYTPPQPNPKQIFEDLQKMRQNILDSVQKDPQAPQNKISSELAMISRLQTLQEQGQGSLTKFPRWLIEILIDMEIRRQYTLRCQQKRPQADFSQLIAQLDRAREGALRDPMYHKDFNVHETDDCLTLYYMLYEREELFKKFLKSAEAFGEVSADEVRARMNFIHFQVEKAHEKVKELERQAQTRDDARAAQGGYNGPSGYFQQGPQACGDGAHNYSYQRKGQGGWEDEAAQADNRRGWQRVGEGTWNPHKRSQSIKNRAGKPTDWDTTKQSGGQNRWSSKQGEAQQYNAWADDKQDQSRSVKGWGVDKNDGWGQNGEDDQWKKTGSRTYEHNFSNHNDWSKKSHSRSDSRKGSSSHRSKKDDGWKSDNGDGRGWSVPSGNNNADDNNWASEAQYESKSRSVQTAVKIQDEDPNAYVKPYWQDWNKPFGRSDSCDLNPKKKRDEPREVYNYPAPTLQAVSNKQAKDVSHGIQQSKGTDYSHKCRKPVYIDTMEQPYAVFSFKYRSKEALEKILKLRIDEIDVKKIHEQVEKDRLMTMPKHKLIEELMIKRAPGKSGLKTFAANGASNDGSGWNDKDGGHKSAASWSDNEWNNKQGSGWSNQGDDNKAGSGWGNQKFDDGRSNNWDADRNNRDQWADQRKPSDRGSRTGSNHSSHKSKSNQRDDVAGWGDTRGNNARFKFGEKGDRGAKPSWDNRPATVDGWDGNNEEEDVSWMDDGPADVLRRDKWKTSKVLQHTDQLRFTTPDFPGMRLASMLQKPPARDTELHADDYVSKHRGSSTLDRWAAEDAEKYGDEEEDSELFRYNYSGRGYESSTGAGW